MEINGWATARRITGAVLFMLALTALYAGAAQAEPRIKVSGCEIYATNRFDPIAFTQHLHHQFGNKSTTNSSTGTSLFNNTSTSCKESWFTSAGWFPVERNEPVLKLAVYYRAPGDQRQLRPIPTGLQLLATDQEYNCNDGSWRDTPPYSCGGEWATRVIFPDCWNQKSLQETATVSSSRRGQCPSTHPYKLPKINYLIRHDNADGVVPNPLTVSSGVDSWGPWDHMHADYFAANQSVFNNVLLDLCLRNVSDSVTVADPRCGTGA